MILVIGVCYVAASAVYAALTIRNRGGSLNPLPLGPRKQLSGSPLRAEHAFGQPELEQVVPRLADQRARRKPEDPHDLPAVELRPDLVELLLLAQHLDPRLERVIGRREPRRLLRVAGGAVGPGQRVQPGKQRARVAHVTAHRGVGPLPVAVAVEPQVQLDEPGHVGDDLLGEPQLGQPLARHLRADHLMVVEGHLAARQQRPGARLADVVQDRRQPQHQVRAEPVAGLQVDRLAEHGQRVL